MCGLSAGSPMSPPVPTTSCGGRLAPKSRLEKSCTWPDTTMRTASRSWPFTAACSVTFSGRFRGPIGPMRTTGVRAQTGRWVTIQPGDLARSPFSWSSWWAKAATRSGGASRSWVSALSSRYRFNPPIGTAKGSAAAPGHGLASGAASSRRNQPLPPRLQLSWLPRANTQGAVRSSGSLGAKKSARQASQRSPEGLPSQRASPTGHGLSR